MKTTSSKTWAFRAGLIITTSLALGALPAAANLITNGDFETGDETGWSDAATASIVAGSSALSGTSSIFLPGGGGGGGFQQFLSTATNATPLVTTFDFSMPDPGGAGTRGLNAFWIESTGGGQVNLRVVDLDDDGDGDVQIFNGTWATVLTDAVNFAPSTANPVLNFLSLTFNGFGAGLSYDLTVNASTATGLAHFQNQTLDDLGRFQFNNQFVTSEFTADNVMISAIPEPTSLAFFGLGCSLLFAARRFR